MTKEERFCFAFVGVLFAVAAAGTLSFVAHEALGIARATIRLHALGTASLVGFAVAGGTLLSRPKEK